MADQSIAVRDVRRELVLQGLELAEWWDALGFREGAAHCVRLAEWVEKLDGQVLVRQVEEWRGLLQEIAEKIPVVGSA